MIETFPPAPMMYIMDTAIFTACLLATFILAKYWRRLVKVNAFLGACTISIGFWVQSSVYVADFVSMTILPSTIGTQAATDVMMTIHLEYAWYASTVSIFLVLVGFGLLVVLVVHQEAKRLKLEQDVGLHQRRLDQAAELAKLGYYIFNVKTEQVEYCSEMHAQNHGISREDYVRKAGTLSNNRPLVHPEDRAMLREKSLQLIAGETVHCEYRVPTPEGERRIREITQPMFAEDGTVVSELGTSLDITEQFETEQKLFQAQKMESIGHLTGGVAHDFNNLLAIILGNLELLQETTSSDEAKSFIDPAIEAINRGAGLTKNMLSFARQARLEPKITDLNDVVRNTKNWSARTLPATIEVETSLLAGLWKILCDLSSTESAILNLILNARDAMPEGGKLTIETANVRIDEEYLHSRNEDIKPGRYVMLAVSDTGQGIPEKNLYNVFEPFFTTKGPGKGSGLGLSMVLGFMKQSGGTVRVYSEKGEGTSFKLYFPADFDVIENKFSEASTDLPNVTSGTRILVAEDEPDLMKVIVNILERVGYHVITAESGDAALELFERSRPVDLLLTDIVMPGKLQGPKLAKVLRQKQPSLAAIFMSGYANEATVHGNGLRPDDIRIMKPISSAKLIKSIEQALKSVV